MSKLSKLEICGDGVLHGIGAREMKRVGIPDLAEETQRNLLCFEHGQQDLLITFFQNVDAQSGNEDMNIDEVARPLASCAVAPDQSLPRGRWT